MGLVRVLFFPFRLVLRNIFTFGNKRPRRLCFWVGMYTIGYNLFDMTYASVVHNSRPALDLKARYGNGTWVVISGASDSIAQEFAQKLSRQGFNLALVDSNAAGLQRTKELAEQASAHCLVQTFQFDHQKCAEWTEYEKLCKNIQDSVGGKENISVLINNVEQKDPYGEKLHKASDEAIIETINMNSFPLVFMSRFLGPDLKARAENGGKSAIINMTSAYADSPSKSLPVFSAAKSFSDVFSQNLYYENQEMDILTVKHMPSKSKANPLGVDSKETVEGILRDLGQQNVSYGHANHSLLRYWILMRQCQSWFNPNTYLGKLSGL